MKKWIIIILLIITIATITQAKETAFTLEDRDRLIRLEVTMKEFKDAVDKRFVDLREDMNKRFEQVDSRITRLEDVMIKGFGLLFTSMIGLVGFVLWDRRTALAPAIRKNKELEEREEELERWKNKADKALKELAEKDTKVAEILKHVGL